MMQILSDFLDRLAAAATLESLRWETGQFFEAQGHPCITYDYVSNGHGGDRPAAGFVSGQIRKVLLDRGVVNDPGRCRPVFELATSFRRPFYWEQLWSGKHGAGRVVRADTRLLVDCPWARDAKQSSALVVPLHHIQGPGGLLAVFSELRAGELDRSLQVRGPALWLAALAADEKMRAVGQSAVMQRIGLSRREKECLEWLSAGLRNDRIAERMGIARATVELHLGRARRKLGAATREQALVKALSVGLLDP
jgi:DNA-binding CsgD family transcriptional regulator